MNKIIQFLFVAMAFTTAHMSLEAAPKKRAPAGRQEEQITFKDRVKGWAKKGITALISLKLARMTDEPINALTLCRNIPQEYCYSLASGVSMNAAWTMLYVLILGVGAKIFYDESCLPWLLRKVCRATGLSFVSSFATNALRNRGWI